MKEFSVPMAITDFIPVTLFFAAALRIFFDLKGKMTTLSGLLYLAGSLMVSATAMGKALYKLIYAVSAGAADITWLDDQFFIGESIGFLLAGTGLLLTIREEKKGTLTRAIAPVGLCVGLIILGETAMYGVLCQYASKMRKRAAIVLFLVSYVFSLIMGYLSSKDMSSAALNWTAQAINTAGQLALLLGAMILHNSGLGREKKYLEDR